MAGLRVGATTGSQTISTAAKTQLQVTAPANQGLTNIDAVCDFLGTSSSGDKVLVELLRLTTAGAAGTSTAQTVSKDDPTDAETVQTTAKKNYTVEPTWTTTTILESRVVHPQSGIAFKRVPRIRGGEALAIRTTLVSGTGPNCYTSMHFDE
jgi:hypothetical protein